VRGRVAIVYNQPDSGRYGAVGEEMAVLGVLEAVDAVHEALLELGNEVIRVPLTPPISGVKKALRATGADLVFNLFEGFSEDPRTEAVVPEILSHLGIPYTGCTPQALRLALDKADMKVLLQNHGIPTPDFQILSPETLGTLRLDYPCIVKPRAEDASHGVTPESVVNDGAALARQVALVSRDYGGGALVEKYIDGREFNATVICEAGCTVFPVSEIVYSLPAGAPRVLTFAAKWLPETPFFDGTRAVCPAEVGTEDETIIRRTALAAFRLLGGHGYGRVDMRFDRAGQLNVLEVNPNPDISPGTGAARQASAAGLSYAEFIARLTGLVPDENRAVIEARFSL
jgi:D-alanine-D-alanine ligase